MDSDETRFFRLLAQAFLEIRTSSYEQGNKLSFKISDIFHNAPFIALKNLEENMPIDYASILKNIEDNAARHSRSTMIGQR